MTQVGKLTPDVALWLAKMLIAGEDARMDRREAEETALRLEALAREADAGAEHSGFPSPNGCDLEAAALRAVAALYRHPESWVPEEAPSYRPRPRR